ncbi:transposase [Methylococcaceae bacterium HT2]|nr:transposase [Methylococcaceae bacterium HT2]
MRTYKRLRTEGGCYFFTVVLAQRHKNNLLIDHINTLRQSFKYAQVNHPFVMDAVVIMPDHLHCIWQLPKNDYNFSTRWRLVKAHFSRSINKSGNEVINTSRHRKGERGIWQRRFWEHFIRDEFDYANHVEYIHYNPVKHGYVDHVSDGKYSSFHHWVKQGLYPANWAAADNIINLISVSIESNNS